MKKSKSEEDNQPKEKDRYYDLKSEFGFKKVISLQRELTRFQAFANAIFRGRPEFSDVAYVPNVINTPYKNVGMKKYDVLCRVTPDTLISAEMARYVEKDFFGRSLKRFGSLVSDIKFYNHDYTYKSFIHINIANFIIWEEHSNYISFMDLRHGEEESRTENYLDVTIELPKFIKNLSELTTELDKWLYLFKNLSNLKEIPEIYDSAFYKDLFLDAECNS